jgi:transcriptional regulator with XRE-family HTH domain
MPRPNRPRSVSSEAAVARRVAILCEQRGWKYPELADRMAEVGCHIQVSALYRLQADPPRSIKVNELIALANVFDIEVTDLLRSPEEVEREWVEEVAKDIVEASRTFDAAQAAVVRAFARLGRLAATSAELEEAVGNQWISYGRTAEASQQWFGLDEFNDVDPELLERCAQYGVDFWHSAAEIADRLVAG